MTDFFRMSDAEMRQSQLRLMQINEYWRKREFKKVLSKMAGSIERAAKNQNPVPASIIDRKKVRL